MKLLVFLLVSSVAMADVTLPVPSTVTLTPYISAPRCSAVTAKVPGYKTVVTGFSSDGNYVLGQVNTTTVCGSSGRGGGLHYYTICAQFQWDLTGNLVSTVATPAQVNGVYVSSPCPDVPVVLPPNTPPGGTVIGNEFTNSGGYVAETVISEACGSGACYATYYYPTLVTP
jgi:hypothetical protein